MSKRSKKKNKLKKLMLPLIISFIAMIVMIITTILVTQSSSKANKNGDNNNYSVSSDISADINSNGDTIYTLSDNQIGSASENASVSSDLVYDETMDLFNIDETVFTGEEPTDLDEFIKKNTE